VPSEGWASASQLSPAYPGTKHWRTVPTVLNAAYAERLFWDGRAGSLEDQGKGPIQAPIEMNQNAAFLVEKLSSIPYYRGKFKKVFDSDVTFDNLAKAVATFERTIVSKNVPFDAYLKGDKSALDEQQVKGLELFVGKARCIKCHDGPYLSDQELHATGVPEIEPLEKDSLCVATRHFFTKDAGYKHAKHGYRIPADYGREIISKDEIDRYKFKTPTLREITITAPYMHNGAFVTLEEVIDFYNKGGGDVPNKDPLLKPLNLTDDEKDALLALLESLTGDEIIVEAPELPMKDDKTF
jgi:cytochrome c peroxidase